MREDEDDCLALAGDATPRAHVCLLLATPTPTVLISIGLPLLQVCLPEGPGAGTDIV